MENQSILSQIDEILKTTSRNVQHVTHDSAEDTAISKNTALLHSTIKRLTRRSSEHAINADATVKQYGLVNSYTVNALRGILEAIKIEYQTGYLKNVEELINADLFSDFLEMSGHLLNESYKDAAAVICGGVLEEHLRKICIKSSIAATLPDGKNKKLESMNTELRSEGVYELIVQKQITAWADLRNSAAHGNYSTYDAAQVGLMIQGIRDFIIKYPA